MISAASFDASASVRNAGRANAVRVWLWIVVGLVLAMIMVGGATRLTQSGLAITEWQPIVGSIPPLSDAAWIDTFDKYKRIPQYAALNRGMSLAQFKVIFWWEWAHRLLGRVTGLAMLLPLLWFLARGRLTRRLAVATAGITALIGLQGGLGWFMVQSGLTGRTDVSQYRLAAHLTLAMIILAGLVAAALSAADHPRGAHLHTVSAGQKRVARGLVVLVLVQAFLGALVAGLKAGLAYNTWPLMAGQVIPAGLGAMSPWYLNPFENALAVQFDHRMMAYLLAAVALVHGWRVARVADDPRVRNSAWLLGLAVLGQTGLGVHTLLAQVPLSLGLMHQAGAALVLMVAVWHAHAIGREDR